MAASVLNGIGALINKENVRTDVNLAEIERRLLTEGKLDNEPVDAEAKFLEEIHAASKALGIPLEEGESSDYDYASSVESGSTNYTQIEKPTSNSYDQYMPASTPTSELFSRTQEQERRSHISNVIGGADTGISFDRERKEDHKLEMLTEIDDLRQVLTNTQADLSRVPFVDPTSNYELVEQVLKILRHKNDMERGCTMAEELILLVTYAAEEAFNGEREYFGYKPNIVGYNNHVSAKFRRMRADTSQAMNTVLQELNIPTPIKMLIELIPGAVMYSHTRSRQARANHTDRMNTGTRNIRKNT